MKFYEIFIFSYFCLAPILAPFGNVAHCSEGTPNESSEKKDGSENSAVLAVDPKEGFKLSEEAQKTLGLLLTPINSQSVHHISKNALVYFQDKVGVYRLRNHYFKLIEVSVLSKANTDVTFKSNEITQGDQVAIAGVALLRVADLDASGGSGEGD